MATHTQAHKTTSRRRGVSVKELGKRLVQVVWKGECTGQAAQLAYYLIFATFPFLLFLATLLGYIPIPNLMDRIM
jgi:membrane protein